MWDDRVFPWYDFILYLDVKRSGLFTEDLNEFIYVVEEAEDTRRICGYATIGIVDNTVYFWCYW